MRENENNQSGFTLVEIAVVLVIVGLLLGSFIGTLAGRIDTTHRDSTKKELEEIKLALIAYAYTRTPPTLPCPDTAIPPDGTEDRVGGVCAAAGAVGTLPWITLGMGYGDSWATRYSYWVDTNYSATAGFALATINGGTALINTRVNDAIQPMATNAAAIVFSRGKNGLGGISIEGVNRPAIPVAGSADETENADANSIFMSRAPTEISAAAAGGAFDDILVWINSYELKAAMVETGVLPP